MRKLILFIAILLVGGVWLEVVEAKINVDRSRVHARVGNRSVHRNVRRNVDRHVRRDIHRDIDIDRRFDFDRDFDFDIDGPLGWVIDDDPDWGWGSFAAGAAASVAGAAIREAVEDDDNDDVIITMPSVGTVVRTLPSSCTRVKANGTTMYRCSNVYYRPYYQGSSLVYKVVGYRKT